jgi:imidazolonepropionase-like amidohydrolase
VNGEAQPTFTLEELKLIVETANSSGRPVVAHAVTAEAMRRAIMAGVKTIEHGDHGTLEIFALMKEKGVGYCPTLGAVDAISRYRGWERGQLPEPQRIKDKRASYQAAIQSECTIIAGGDVGVFPHGDNAMELELMVEYGMMADKALRSATSVNADFFGLADRGRIKENLLADILVVQGDPSKNIRDLKKVRLVMKGGVIVREEESMK